MNLRESIIEQQAIEIAELKAKIKSRDDADLRAEMMMTRVGVPSSFEDGNSSDSLGFHERIHILCDMLLRATTDSEAIRQECSPPTGD